MSKPKGYFDKFLAFDCETSGMAFGDNPSKDYQIVSAGLIVADFTFKPIEELYVEIQWNGHSKWDAKAESIHGMSKDYLAKNGLPEIEAVEKIGALMYDHFGMDSPISLLGHNVGTFDLPFLRKTLSNYDLNFKFAHRHMDTFSLAMGTFQAYNSDDLFEMMGFEKRKSHNALADARYALETFRIINKFWAKYVLGE